MSKITSELTVDIQSPVSTTKFKLGLRLFAWLARHQNFQAALVLSALLLIFFSTPLAKFGDSYYSPADLTQSYSFTRIESNYNPGNFLMSDPVLQMQPWLMFSRDSLRNGQIPLWNPYNGGGAPLLANYQSAVFSIYSLPFYLLDFRFALLVSAFMKLFGLGFFCFLFLKQIEAQQLPALIGATAFMFSGYHVLWLNWPHVGAVIILPAGLYFTERILRAFAAPKPRYKWLLAGLCLSLVVGLLSGHPETFYFCFLLLAAYILFRLLNLWVNSGYSRVELKRLALLMGQISLAGLFALGLAALQLVPFYEYFNNSAVAEVAGFEANREGMGAENFLRLDFWPLFLLPNLLGNTTQRYKAIDQGLFNFFTNYIDVNSLYIGGLVLFLAGLSLLFVRRNKFIGFFAGVAVVWFFCTYNILGVGSLFKHLPFVSLTFLSRSAPVWFFSLSCCAALGLNQLFNRPLTSVRNTRILIFVTAVAAITLITANLIFARQLVAQYAKELLPVVADLQEFVPKHLRWFGLTFTPGLLVVISLFWAKSTLIKTLLGSAILLIIFSQSGFLLKDYNPTSSQRFFYPVTPSITAIQQLVGDKNLIIVGNDIIPPDTNLVYKITMPANYDALWIKHYDELYRAMFIGQGYWRRVWKFDEKALQLFGVEYVMTTEMLDRTNFELIRSIGLFNLYHYRYSLASYYLVSDAQIASTEKVAFESVLDPAFKPSESVILNTTTLPVVSASVTTEPNRVQVISQTATNIRLRADNANSAYLVITKPYYPGWHIKVNGVEKPLLKANYAFNAVALPAGQNEIEFYYEATSFKIGLLISFLTAVTGIGLLLFWRKPNRIRIAA